MEYLWAFLIGGAFCVIGQILLAKRMGKKKVIAETGAGQHGVATATGAALFDMECTVFMGEVLQQNR